MRVATVVPGYARGIVSVMLLLCVPRGAQAQDPMPQLQRESAGAARAPDSAPSTRASDRPRTMTITPGLGNAMGWLGVQGERYFRGDRLSVFLGLGYTPAVDPGDPSGLTAAAGLRGYTPGLRHRAFLELSVSQIAVELRPDGERLYGPGLQAGYQFTTLGGFTLMASAGLGYAVGSPDYVVGSAVQALLGFGIGYTWR